MEKFIQIDFQLLGTSIMPKKISEQTGIKPDVELARGERNKKSDLPRQNVWAIRSQVESEEVGDHWNFLEPLLSDKRELLREIAKTGSAKLTLIISGHARIPSLIIPPAMSEFAGFVGAVIDIDHLQH